MMERNKFTCAARGCDGCSVCQEVRMSVVICTDDSGFEDQLTKGCGYTVLKHGEGSYLVEGDEGVERWYGASKFQVYTG